MFVLTTLSWVGIGILILIAIVVGAVASFLLVALAEHYLYRLSHFRTMKAFAKLDALNKRLDNYVPRKTRNDRLTASVGEPANRVAHAIFMLENRRNSLQRDNDLRRGAFTRREWKYLREDVNKVLKRADYLEIFILTRGKNDGIWPFNDRLPSFVAPNNYARDRKQWERPECSHRVWGKGALDEDVYVPERQEPVLRLAAPIQPSARPATSAKVVDLTAIPRKPNALPDGVYNNRGQVVPFARPARKVNVRV